MKLKTLAFIVLLSQSTLAAITADIDFAGQELEATGYITVDLDSPFTNSLIDYNISVTNVGMVSKLSIDGVGAWDVRDNELHLMRTNWDIASLYGKIPGGFVWLTVQTDEMGQIFIQADDMASAYVNPRRTNSMRVGTIQVSHMPEPSIMLFMSIAALTTATRRKRL